MHKVINNPKLYGISYKAQMSENDCARYHIKPTTALAVVGSTKKTVIIKKLM